MGRLIGLLALLNGGLLVTGLSMEHVRGQPAVLVDFNADKVRLVGRVEPAAPARVAMETRPAPLEPVQGAVVTAVAPTSRCLSWSGLDEDLLAAIEARLQDSGIAAGRYDIHLRKRLGWWVYLPPFTDVEAMRAAIDAARLKGVKDIAPVRGGEMENAVSLGAFPTLEKARAQMERMRALGIQGLRMGPRPKSGGARLTIADDVPEDKLIGLAQGWRKGHSPVTCASD